MKQYKPKNERGSALVMALLALMILAAVGMGMIYTANTETSVNNNYRNSQQAYFAARAGLEEVRDRIFTNSIANLPSPKVMGLGKGLPGQQGGAIYVINSTGSADPVVPWDPNNKYFDDEYCHEYYFDPVTGTQYPTGVKCTAAQLPPGNNWYSSINANALPAGVPLSYKWVRITLKTNQSLNQWAVDVNTAKAYNNNLQACYDGIQELELLPAITPVSVTPPVVTPPSLPPATSKATKPDWAPKLGLSRSDMLATFLFGHGGNGGGNGGGGGNSSCDSVTQGTSGAPACGCGSPQMATNPYVIGAATCVDAGLEPIYVLTSLAVTGNGTRRMMQQEISRTTTPWPPASLSFAGPINSVDFGTSANYTIDGKDIINTPTNPNPHLSNAACGPDVPSVGATQDQMPVNGNGVNNNPSAFQQVVAAGSPPAAKAPYQGSDSGPNPGQCPTSTSDIRDASLPLQGSTSTTAELQQIYQHMLSIADYVGPASGITTQAQAGTDVSPNAPKINIIQGDCIKCNAFSGAGVLVVTGNLTTAGQTTFNGLVIVLGGTVVMDGTSNINGGLMVGNLNNPSTPGINFSVAGGGTAGGVHYDSCRIINAQNQKTFKVLATREVLY